MSSRRHAPLAACVLSILAASAFATSAHADGASGEALNLNTACINLKAPFQGATPPSKMTGSGAFDANAAAMAMPDGSQRLFVAYDTSGQWRKNSGIVPEMAVVDLKKDGLAIVKKEAWLGSAKWDTDRLFMRPAITALPGSGGAPGYFFLTGASEDNGTSNNPRTTALLYDANGDAVLNVVGIGRDGKVYGPRGERGIDMGAIAGRDNGQQQGASSVYFIGKDADAYVIAVAFQENNQRAYVAFYRLTLGGAPIDGKTPGATITAIADAALLQGEARHTRPTCAVAQGTSPAEIACATVHATEQPAEKGITIGRFDTKTGALLSASDVVRPAADDTVKDAGVVDGALTVPKGYRFSQSLLDCADAACSTYVLETSHVRKQKTAGNNGHTPGIHATDVILVAPGTLAAESFTSIGNYAHTHMVPVTYGPGDGAPGIGVLTSSLTGANHATLQILGVDLGAKKLTPPTPSTMFPVAYLTNNGATAAAGLRNPTDQGRSFLSAVANVANPGAGGGFMPAVRSFTAVPMPSFGAGPSNFMGLDLCFVPATYLDGYKVAPGSVVAWDAAPVGAPPDPAHPNDPVNAADGSGVKDGAGGCSATPTPVNDASGAALAAFLTASVVVAARRRRGR